MYEGIVRAGKYPGKKILENLDRQIDRYFVYYAVVKRNTLHSGLQASQPKRVHDVRLSYMKLLKLSYGSSKQLFESEDLKARIICN